MSGTAPDDEAIVRCLGACLAVAPAPLATMALRVELLQRQDLRDAAIKLAARTRLASALWSAIPSRELILNPGGATPHPASGIADAWAGHCDRSAQIAAVLREIVAALNAAGLVPLLLKGAQAVWTGAPAWRHVRDIDLLLPPDDAEAAQRILRGLGFAPYPGRAERPDRHHLTPLFRDDFPAWVEVHRRAANGYAERLVGTSEIMVGAKDDRVVDNGRDGLHVRFTAPATSILYALVHHHVGHGADARGTVDLKGLYEFASAIMVLRVEERAALVARADRNPRLAAMLDFWTAAAADLFGLPVDAPLRLTPDAAARWRRALARRTAGTPDGSAPAAKYPGYGDELAMAMDAERLSRAPHGGNPLGRLRLRAAIIASLLPPLLRRAG